MHFSLNSYNKMNAIDQAIDHLKHLQTRGKQLVKLRSTLLKTVDEINQILKDGKKRGRKGPRPNRPPTNKPKKTGRRKNAVVKNWPELKKKAISVPGFAGSYYFIKDLGVVSLKNKYPRLMCIGSNKCISFTKKDGTPVPMTRATLAKKLKMSVEALGI